MKSAWIAGVVIAITVGSADDSPCSGDQIGRAVLTVVMPGTSLDMTRLLLGASA